MPGYGPGAGGGLPVTAGWRRASGSLMGRPACRLTRAVAAVRGPTLRCRWPRGGAIRIQADGLVLVNGVITANGGAYPPGYGNSQAGSGGSIFIACHTLAGTNSGANGVISANGGNGGGGGGRIAVNYTNVVPGAATIRFSVDGGGTGPWALATSGRCISPTPTCWARPDAHRPDHHPGFTNWSLTSLTVSNGWSASRWRALGWPSPTVSPWWAVWVNWNWAGTWFNSSAPIVSFSRQRMGDSLVWRSGPDERRLPLHVQRHDECRP